MQASVLHSQPPLPSADAGPAGDAAEEYEAEAASFLSAQGTGLSPADLRALLASVPQKPPGWKPGDPIPFAAPEARREDLRYVPRVDLGSLNPDLDAEMVYEMDEGDSDSSD